jgi:hypothetical protein
VVLKLITDKSLAQTAVLYEHILQGSSEIESLPTVMQKNNAHGPACMYHLISINLKATTRIGQVTSGGCDNRPMALDFLVLVYVSNIVYGLTCCCLIRLTTAYDQRTMLIVKPRTMILHFTVPPTPCIAAQSIERSSFC